MDRPPVISIIIITRIVALALIAILALLYAIPLCFIRRFHKPLHLLTLNVCIAAFLGTAFWTIDYTLDTFYTFSFWSPKSCLPIIYLQNMLICQELYAVCAVSINRLFTVLYRNKKLFRTKKWVGICVIIQWIVGTLLPLPILFADSDTCLIFGIGIGYRFYVFIISIMVPAVFVGMTNTFIFIYTRKSTQRVQPMHRDNEQTGGFSQRDIRLLKHMLFIFSMFVLGSAPIHILMILRWYDISVPLVIFQILLTLPVFTVFTDVTDLFIYNHELRKYLFKRQQVEPVSQTRERTRTGL